jgi:hypothetical protein
MGNGSLKHTLHIPIHVCMFTHRQTHVHPYIIFESGDFINILNQSCPEK